MPDKIKAAIIGPGNIGMDLMFKLMRSKYIDVDMVVGIIPESEGLLLAKKYGKKTSAEGIDAILGNKDIKIVFDATSAKAHLKHAPLLEKDGKIAIDLTPAAAGPYCVPAITMEEQLNFKNVNMVTCAGQATTPIVHIINKIADVKYAEIVATISSRSAGPGTRANIDEFTETTAKSLESLGGADKGKAIIILNPAEPPIMMRNTIYTKVANPNAPGILEAIENIAQKIKKYVPGYHFKVPPIIDGDKITTIIEVEGEGAYLPKYAGNLDIITAAAVAFADEVAKKLLVEMQTKEGRVNG